VTIIVHNSLLASIDYSFLASTTMTRSLIVLDVSGCVYKTQKATLQTSPYFRNIVGRWNDCCDRQDDGSLFVDADPKTFQHILDFMRRPSKFPLFWTKHSAFDYALYNKLEEEADYFVLHDLRDWIKQKRYLDAVKTIVEVQILSEGELMTEKYRDRWYADCEVQSHFGSYSGEKRLRNECALHRDKEVLRGCRYCKELVQAFGPQYDEPQKTLTVVIKRTEFDETVCVNSIAPCYDQDSREDVLRHTDS
jgi:hypothetical protein